MTKLLPIPAPAGEKFFRHKDYRNVFVSKGGLIAFKLTMRRYFLFPTSITKKGYVRVRMGAKWILAHRVVASAFHCNKGNKPFINHKNGIKSDNHKDNLEWCTTAENNRHSYHVLNNDSQFKKRSVLIYKDGVLVNKAISVREAARLVNGDHSLVSRACKRQLLHKGYKFQYA
jgi:hypothetical protein